MKSTGPYSVEYCTKITMNFSPFGTFPQTIAGAGVHHFPGAKFAQNIAPGGQVLGVISSGEGGVYLRPVDNGFSGQSGPQLITLPITVAEKSDSDQAPQTIQIQVVNPNAPALSASAGDNNAPKYVVPLQIQGFPQGAATLLTLAYNQAAPGEPLQLQLQSQIELATNGCEMEANNNSSVNSNNNNNGDNNNDSSESSAINNASSSNVSNNNNNETSSSGNAVQTNENLSMEEKSQGSSVDTFPLSMGGSDMIVKNSSDIDNKSTQTSSDKDKDFKEEASEEDDVNADNDEFLNSTLTMPSSWHNITTPGTAVADYLSKMPGNTLPLNLHHFLRFSAETIKREQAIESSPLSGDYSESYQNGIEESADLEVDANGKAKKKKRPVKKKPPRPKKPRPGQVHIATALDGTTLFCCPECHMAYPEKDLLEQHLVGHKIERRFICDICGAGLKRKEHLERHKLGHNPERPFVCQICMKGFKRKEHLNLHAVIHSGEKTEICTECGKGFYRKDHLRKHARSHITKKIKEAAQAQAQTILEAQQLAQQTQFSIPIPNMPGVSVIPISQRIMTEDSQNAVISTKTEVEDNELPNLSHEHQAQVTITTTNSSNIENNGVRQNAKVK